MSKRPDWRARRRRALEPSMMDWASVHARWLDNVDSTHDLGPDRRRVSEYAADVVETLFVRPAGIGGALTRFGNRLGAEGWTLENVSRWVDQLAELCPGHRAVYLRSFGSGVSLARGWTEGNLRGLRAEECFDGVTGLCTTAVLKIRLNQLFEQCAAMDVAPNWLYRVVVFDADVNQIGPLEGDATMVVLADVIQQTFTAGETIIRESNRIFVLCSRDEGLQDRVHTVLDGARDLSLLRSARVLGWVEDLPAVAAHIDRYMSDLSV